MGKRLETNELAFGIAVENLHKAQSLAAGMPLPVLKVPGAHIVQLVAELAPRVALYRPGMQRVQFVVAGMPEPVPYVPATHALQVVPALAPRAPLEEPGGHRVQRVEAG